MYNSEGRKIKLFNILISIIALFIIIFIVIWAVNKGDNNSAQTLEQFNTNMNEMHEVAKEFFAGNLPEDIGDTLKITLGEMYDIGLTDELTYGNTSCDTEESYISITKSSDNEYRVKSNLVCGEKTDSLTEKITSNTVVEDTDGETILDEEKDDIDLEVEDLEDEDRPTSSDGKTPDSEVKCTGPVCTFIQVPVSCTTEYTYEHVRRQISCPAGYTIGDTACVMVSTDTKKPTANYTPEKTQVVDAKVNTGESYRVYVDPVVESENGTYYCPTGTKVGNYCYTYAAKETVTEKDCPSGYTEVGNYCYKYADKIESTEKDCPSGYTRSGNYCYKYTNKVTSSTSGCPAGYDQSGNYCYKYADKVSSSNTTTKCPSGTTPSNGKCLKVINAVKSYSAWGNPTSTYQTRTKESTYTYELSKKVLVGSNKIGNSTVYTYAIYKRTTYYSCAIGDKVGTQCYVYSEPEKSSTTTYKCPSGYTENSSGKCYMRTNLQTSSTSKCPSGYTEDTAGRCYVRTGLVTNPVSECPSGYTESGSVCYIRKNKTTTSYTECPSGYKEDTAGKCYVRTNAKYSGDNLYYTCPKGYTQTGTGKNTQCYKLEKSDDEYYCENANATLKDKLCYIKVEAQFIGNSCDYGYIYNESDKLCHKTNQVTTPYIWSDAEYIYTHNKYEAGYQRTGKGSFVQTCTRIDDETTSNKVYK